MAASTTTTSACVADPASHRWTPLQLAWGLLATGLLLSFPETSFLLRVPTAGLACIALGLLAAIGAKRQFRSADTPVCPSAEPRTLLTHGWFGTSRNPMYLGLGLVLFGVGLLMGTVPALLMPLLFWSVVGRHFVPHEEARCAAAFGDDWESYTRAVPRWL